jgi:tetratricopeptide (TPR) repeat protein
VFSWTYRRLAADDPAAARVFRLLSLHPGATFRAEVVDVLTGGDGQAALDTLAGVHLVRPEAHRYAQHDLLRLYARELADRTDADADEVRHRLLTWYLDRVQAADRWITPTRPREPGPPATAFPGDAEALAWLEEERGTLVAVTEEAARRGETDLVSELALFAVAFFDRRYHLHEWIRTLELAVETADRADDRSRLPAAVYNLAGGYRKVRRFAEAEAHYRRFQEQLDPAGEQTWRYRAASRYMLGNTLQDQRRFTEAETEFRAALDGFTGGGAAYEAAHVRLSLGDVQRDLTRYGEAEGNLRDALDEIARREREAGKGDGEALARWALAVLLLETGRDEEAAEQAGQSLRLARANHNVDHEGWALLAAAAASRATGRPDQAAELLREAEDLFTRTEDRYRLALALAEHARTHLAVGRAGPAHRDAARAIDLLRTWDDPQARHVSDGLARDRDSWPAG